MEKPCAIAKKYGARFQGNRHDENESCMNLTLHIATILLV
jgi:hypothetical protein